MIKRRRLDPGLILDESVFAPVHTFMGAPQSWDLANAKAAVLGIPFEQAERHELEHGHRGCTH